eukprot:758587-Hanusia_phi.AAC.2
MFGLITPVGSLNLDAESFLQVVLETCKGIWGVVFGGGRGGVDWGSVRAGGCHDEDASRTNSGKGQGRRMAEGEEGNRRAREIMPFTARILHLLLFFQCAACLPLDPRKHPSECGRASPSWVCDPDEVLGEKAADRIDMIARSINAGGTKIAVSVMKKLKEDYGKDNTSDDKKAWSCTAAGHRAAKAIITLWSADALVLLSHEDKNFCVVTRGNRIPLSEDDNNSIMMDVQDPLINGIPEYAVMFAILRMKVATFQRIIACLMAHAGQCNGCWKCDPSH